MVANSPTPTPKAPMARQKMASRGLTARLWDVAAIVGTFLHGLDGSWIRCDSALPSLVDPRYRTDLTRKMHSAPATAHTAASTNMAGNPRVSATTAAPIAGASACGAA